MVQVLCQDDSAAKGYLDAAKAVINGGGGHTAAGANRATHQAGQQRQSQPMAGTSDIPPVSQPTAQPTVQHTVSQPSGASQPVDDFGASNAGGANPTVDDFGASNVGDAAPVDDFGASNVGDANPTVDDFGAADFETAPPPDDEYSDGEMMPSAADSTAQKKTEVPDELKGMTKWIPVRLRRKNGPIPF